jgi:hypothetical protein
VKSAKRLSKLLWRKMSPVVKIFRGGSSEMMELSWQR